MKVIIYLAGSPYIAPTQLYKEAHHTKVWRVGRQLLSADSSAPLIPLGEHRTYLQYTLQINIEQVSVDHKLCKH